VSADGDGPATPPTGDSLALACHVQLWHQSGEKFDTSLCVSETDTIGSLCFLSPERAQIKFRPRASPAIISAVGRFYGRLKAAPRSFQIPVPAAHTGIWFSIWLMVYISHQSPAGIIHAFCFVFLFRLRQPLPRFNTDLISPRNQRKRNTHAVRGRRKGALWEMLIARDGILRRLTIFFLMSDLINFNISLWIMKNEDDWHPFKIV
jgi:hypothetical protein